MNARRRILLFTLLLVAIVVGFAFRAWWLEQRAGVYARVAAQLNHSLSSEPRFAAVTVRRTRHNIVVLAPDTLQEPDRATLQSIVAEQAKPLDVQVLYTPAPGSPR